MGGRLKQKIYLLIVDCVYGNSVAFINLDKNQNTDWLKNLQNKIISKHLRDTTWLVTVRRLPVRAVVKVAL